MICVITFVINVVTVLHYPHQLDSIKLFPVRMHPVSGTYTPQTFGHPNCDMILACVLFIPWSTGQRLLFFLTSKSYPAKWRWARTPWQTFSVTTLAWISIYLCYTEPVLPLRWSMLFVHTVVRPLYTTCHAINRHTVAAEVCIQTASRV